MLWSSLPASIVRPWMGLAASVLLLSCGTSPVTAPSAADSPATTPGPEVGHPYQDRSRSVEDRVTDLLGRMTIEEKIAMVSGNGLGAGGDGFATVPLTRLGIPEFKMTDGPVGVRWGRATAFPASIAMAASWDIELLERLGGALARETKGHGRNVLLGPCVNIHRVPQGGRNFESFGEDPFLAARMSVAYIQGVQAESVVATVKHFACNNQETDRGFIDARVSDRALNEIYWPAFKASVNEARVGAVMSAYNKLNGAWCSENSPLLEGTLKERWGFRGFVVSDWHSVHSTVPAATSGLDLEMPGPEFLGAKLAAAVKNGSVPVEVIEDKVRRLLRVMMEFGIFDGDVRGDASAVGTAEHRTLAREAGAAGIVLLKNQGALLPVGESVRRIAVIGPHAALAVYGGGGSSRVNPVRSVTPLDALRARAGNRITIEYAVGRPLAAELQPVPANFLRQPGRDGGAGLKGEYFANTECAGTPVLTRVDAKVDFHWGVAVPAPGLSADGFSVRWTGRLVPDRTGEFELGVGADDGIQLFLDGRKVIDHWSDHAFEARRSKVRLVAGRSYDLRIEYYEKSGDAAAQFGWRVPGEDSELDAAVAAAKRADLVLVFTGLTDRDEYEGADRAHLDLPEGQDELIRAVAAANPRTVVILQSGSPVLITSWVGRVPALLEAWYPGEECGNAIADVLFGDVNPSARLPFTFPARAADVAALTNFPGNHVEVRYEEDIFVGYRHFDRAGIVPLFPFGHGLSYTTFGYRNAAVRPLGGNRFEVSVEVGNEGTRRGAEVVQLYVAPDRSTVVRPPQELKGFRRVELEPGEWKTVSWTIGPESFAHWDAGRRDWTVEPGAYHIRLGSSSRALRASVDVTIAES